MTKRPIFRVSILIALTACGSNLGTLGVVNDEDAGAGVDAGHEASTVDTGAPDAAPDGDAPSTFGSPDGGRSVATPCADAGRPPGKPQDAGGCKADTDCDAGADGRCDWRGFSDGGSANVCTYNQCVTDSTCSGAGACGCAVGSLSDQNLCLSNSNCRVDGDCPGGERCVLSYPIVLGVSKSVFEGNEVGGINYSGQALGYFCTTPQDSCRDANRPDGTAVACTYNSDSKRWQWATGP